MNILTRYWRRRNAQRALAGDISAMDRVYAIRDPWELDTKGEHFRFAETTRIIRERIAEHFGSILEIGCGEGLQTKYLAPLAERVVGLDPSRRAIGRTKGRQIVNATFVVGGLLQYEPNPPKMFDLVTACEVLYYCDDLDLACEKLARLGRNCVATYYQGAFDRLDSYFKGRQVEMETIRGASCQWRVVYWMKQGV